MSSRRMELISEDDKGRRFYVSFYFNLIARALLFRRGEAGQEMPLTALKGIITMILALKRPEC
jgi:hypothetical protein